MLSRENARKKNGESSGTSKFLSDIDTISKSFYADKKLQRLTSSTASSRSKSVANSNLPEPKMKPKDTKKNKNDSLEKDKKDLLEKDKKSSIWSWKGLKALTQVRNHKFNCCFSLLVHSIEGLPDFFNDICLVVHWKRQDGEQMTRPIRVYQGVAEFEEQLTHSCSVYGSKSGPHHSAKYGAKNFLLYASVSDAPELDLGKHRIDLTRLLPLTLDELEEEKSLRKWTTSFRLSGKARGAMMNVSFGYVVIDSNSTELQNSARTSELRNGFNRKDEISICKIGSLPVRSIEDIKDLHEVLPKSELGDSVNMLYQKMDEGISNASIENKLETNPVSSQSPDTSENICESDSKIREFPLMDKGMDELILESVKSEGESLMVARVSTESPQAEETFPNKNEKSINFSSSEEKENELYSKESLMKELETALESLNDGLDSEDGNDPSYQENYLDVESQDGDCLNLKSLSLDDITDSVANDFLDMLGIENTPFDMNSESEPESPREQLLRQFENDFLANGDFLNFEIDNDSSEDSKEKPNIEIDSSGDKISTSRMEDLETEVLMREWGLNEKAFQNSPPKSPVNIPPKDSQELPPIAEGLPSFVETENGGFLRSMNPFLFRNAQSGGSLIMQVSNPVVVPAEMGSGVMGILQGLASLGIEKLSMQANKLMPLEDISGKTIEQMAWENSPRLEGLERQDFTQPDSETLQNISSLRSDTGKPSGSKSVSLSNDTEYVSLEDLAPLAMDKIEALSIEGLRIQSGMSDHNAPANISSQSIGDFSALKGRTTDIGGSIGLDGTCGLQLLDIKDNGEDVDGLMGLSLTLDEWMKLDSGEIDENDLGSDHTSKILTAHHATSLELFRGISKGEKKRGKGKKYGLLGNNFTVALMVQLRDPLRDYEPVGAPMLALIQVERVFIPPKPKIYSTVSLLGDSNEDDDETEAVKKENNIGKLKEDKIHEEAIPQYKITEVHVSGLKTEPGKKKLWGSNNQQQSGSRWLLANGMGKKDKHPLMKSKSSGRPGDKLWGISSR